MKLSKNNLDIEKENNNKEMDEKLMTIKNKDEELNTLYTEIS